MGRHLLLRLWLHGDGLGVARYHGVALGGPEWPPSPARVFQALVAGASRPGEGLAPDATKALAWLERRAPPTILAPRRSLGQAVSLYVPNNDADALPDPRDVSSVRTQKRVQPSLFSADQPVVYAWEADDADAAGVVAAVARDVYQLGRGVDMAWAAADVVDDAALEAALEAHPGTLLRHELGARGSLTLACPTSGSLVSLEARFHAQRTKLVAEGRGKVRFTNPPKPLFAMVGYEVAKERLVFELRDREEDRPWPWPLTRVASLVERVRDAAVARLVRAAPGEEGRVEACLIGRRSEDLPPIPASARVRIVPLPSIGSAHADRGVRRFAVEIPSATSIAPRDLAWAFTSLEEYDPTTGEAGRWIALRAVDESMLGHYRGPARRWRSVTAVALPESAKRRRIEPVRRREEAKPAQERIEEEARAQQAVRDALRHAGVRASARRIHVQREPFDAKGERAEAFAHATRFAKERFWHVEVELEEPHEGPLVLGDGRFLGLGLLAPVQEEPGVWAFSVVSPFGRATAPQELATHLRRAVMARAQAALGGARSLPTFFDGHGDDGGRARREEAGHLAFAFDPASRRLLVIAPHVHERRTPRQGERAHLATLARALEGFVELVAGRAGRLRVRRGAWWPEHEPLAVPSRSWESVTRYVVTRHAKGTSAEGAIAEDVLAECRRAALPVPVVQVTEAGGRPGLGLMGLVRLEFAVAVPGPLLLGRDRHRGGGLFRALGVPQAPAR